MDASNISPEQLQAQIDLERVRMHRRQARSNAGITLAVAVCVAFMFGANAPLWLGYAWGGGLLLVLSLRLFIARSQPEGAAEDAALAPRWLLRHRLAYGLHGLVWMSAALALLEIGHPLPSGLFVFTCTALASGAVLASYYDPYAGMSFATPVLTPLFLYLVSASQLGDFVSGIVALGFAVVLLWSLYRVDSHLRRTTRRRLELDAQIAHNVQLGLDTQKAREALQSQDLLRQQLLETTTQGYWYIDARGTTLEVNPAMCRLLGRPAADVLGRPVYDFFDGDTLAQMRAELTQRRQGVVGAYRISIVQADGRRVHCQVNATPRFDASGQFLGSVGFWADISDLVNANDTLQMLEQAVNSLSDVVSVVDEEARYCLVNDAWVKATGIPRAQALGQDAFVLLAGVRDGDNRPLLQTCLAERRSMVLRQSIKLPALEGRVMETRLHPFERPGPQGRKLIVMVSQDVTTHEQVLQTLRQTDAQHVALLEAFPGMIACLDEQLVYRFANDRMAALLGREPADLLGLSVSEVFGPIQARQIEDDARRALAGETVVTERSMDGGDGRGPLQLRFTLAAGVEPVTGRPMVYSFGQDITAQYRERLAQRLGPGQMRWEASGALGALAYMAQELRRPSEQALALAGQLQGQGAGLGGGLTPTQRPLVARLAVHGARLVGLANDLHEIARLGSGQQRIECQAVALGPLLREATGDAHGRANERGVRLQGAGVADDLPRVWADPLRLQRVLQTLVPRAIAMAPHAGVVALQAQVQGPMLRVEFRGLGTDRPVFAATSLRQVGSSGADAGAEDQGSSLALCQWWVEGMDGRLQWEDPEDPAISATLLLPLAAASGRRPATAPVGEVDAAVAADAAAASGDGQDLPPADVLCIEDNPLNLELLRAMLEQRSGLRAICCASPLDGLEQARRVAPGLILLDLQMPEMSGHQVLARLRADPLTFDVPVCAVSANAVPQDIEAALAAGFDAYLTKPLNADALDGVLRRLLRPRKPDAPH